MNAGIRLDDFRRDQVGGPGINAPGVCGGKHRHRHEHGKRSGQPPQLACRPRLQANTHRELLRRLRDSQSPIGSELDSTGAQYNGISATLVNVPPQEARSIEVGTKWELFDKRTARDSGIVPDRRRSRPHQ